jgi:hypothetical protein
MNVGGMDWIGGWPYGWMHRVVSSGEKAMVQRPRSRSSSLCLLLTDCDLCAAGFRVSHHIGCGFFGVLGRFICIGIYFSLFGSDLRKN